MDRPILDPDLAKAAEGLTRSERLKMARTLEIWAKQLRMGGVIDLPFWKDEQRCAQPQLRRFSS